MIKQYWDKISNRIDELSLRERVLVFAAAAFLLVSLVNTLLLDPMLQKQKNIYSQLVQQQEKSKEIQAQIDAILQAKNSQGNSPQQQYLNRLKQELNEGSSYLQSNREKLVRPENMADLLRQVLSKNSNLQLLALQTLPATPLLEKESTSADANITATSAAAPEKQIFKHGVEMTMRGNYLDLLQYLTALERLPTQMFWGKVKLEVVQYPAAELTLILYTLSLDKIWLQV